LGCVIDGVLDCGCLDLIEIEPQGDHYAAIGWWKTLILFLI
jgi:hypothetical protein